MRSDVLNCIRKSVRKLLLAGEYSKSQQAQVQTRDRDTYFLLTMISTTKLALQFVFSNNEKGAMAITKVHYCS